ncbi:hypothetical protein [Mycolicibacterium goodii]|nr:hypothetical protein [Mycolicibacterium goodii]MBU8833826.1 hypothetical protein [Mycolicibacterium goodii]
MTDAQDAAWRQFAAVEIARFQQERAALAAQLGAEHAAPNPGGEPT